MITEQEACRYQVIVYAPKRMKTAGIQNTSQGTDLLHCCA